MLTFWTRIERSMLRNSRLPSMPSLISALSVPPEEPAKSEPATLDLESLVEQLQKSPELASALAALIAAQAPAK